MGLFGFLDRQAGDSRLSKDLSTFTKTGYDTLNAGNATTNEGLAGLRGLDTQYQGMLADPLGPAGRSIFTRARGLLTDQAQQKERASQARIFQLATQNGGTLSPEAQAELQSNNQRGINESLFGAQGELATNEAKMTLDQTSKLFDRMEGIRKTIVGVGQDETTRGLQAIIASLAGRTDRMKAIWGDVTSAGNAAHH